MYAKCPSHSTSSFLVVACAGEVGHNLLLVGYGCSGDIFSWSIQYWYTVYHQIMVSCSLRSKDKHTFPRRNFVRNKSSSTNHVFSFVLFVEQPEGASQKIDFSCNPEIVVYVPSIKLRTYPFPFLAANVDDLDEVSSIETRDLAKAFAVGY